MKIVYFETNNRDRRLTSAQLREGGHQVLEVLPKNLADRIYHGLPIPSGLEIVDGKEGVADLAVKVNADAVVIGNTQENIPDAVGELSYLVELAVRGYEGIRIIATIDPLTFIGLNPLSRARVVNSRFPERIKYALRG